MTITRITRIVLTVDTTAATITTSDAAAAAAEHLIRDLWHRFPGLVAYRVQVTELTGTDEQS